MNLARVLIAASACVALGATAVACSGSFGSGSGLPGTLASPGFGGPATPSPTPSSTTSILTYGESTAFQNLPELGGYGASIAFAKAPEPTKAPEVAAKGKKDATPAAAPTPVAIAIGATLSIAKPADGPDLNFESGKGKKKRSREHPARALAYITLLPTHDITLDAYPRVALEIPREVASQYRDGEFGLALWNAGEKDAKYRLAVAELDTVTTPPPIARPVAAATTAAKAGASGAPAASSTPAATPKPSGAASSAPGAFGVPNASGVPAPSAAPTLPPQRILFAATASTLKLVANRPAVFALYALPHPAAGSPLPSGSPKASGSSAPSSKTESAAPKTSGSPAPPAKTDGAATSAASAVSTAPASAAPTKGP
jgi:hypothetical protein